MLFEYLLVLQDSSVCFSRNTFTVLIPTTVQLDRHDYATQILKNLKGEHHTLLSEMKEVNCYVAITFLSSQNNVIHSSIRLNQ